MVTRNGYHVPIRGLTPCSPQFVDRWHNFAQRKALFDDLEKKLQIKAKEDWYNIKIADVQKLNSEIVQYYDFSLSKALKDVYPGNPLFKFY